MTPAPEKHRRPDDKKNRFGTWTAVVIGLLLGAYALVIANSRPRVDGERLRLDQFVQAVNNGQVRDARILDQDEFVVGTYERDDGSLARYNLRLADIPRTSTYQVLEEELQNKGLAERVPGEGAALWVSRGPDEVLARLEAAQEARLRQHRERSERVRDMLSEALSESPTPVLPYVQVIHEPARVSPPYEQMLAEATEELLVFNRPPYSSEVGRPRPMILETAQRVRTRVLYRASQIDDPNGDLWRREMAAHHAAGAEGRVVDSLPLKRPYAFEWGARVRTRGGRGRLGQVTPPAWSRTRSR